MAQHDERVSADRRWFTIDAERWTAFEAILAQPTKPDERLIASLHAPDPFADPEDND